MNILFHAVIFAFICGSFAFIARFPGGRIVGGYDAIPEQTKHQVSLRFHESDSRGFGRGFQCGASLISPDLVLTAAHCVFNYGIGTGAYDAQDFVVVMGNIYRFNKTAQTQIRHVKSLVMHEEFEEFKLRNDIALLKLEKPFELNDVVATIPLATHVTMSDANCMVTGWGTTKYGPFPNHLLAVNVSMIEMEVCNSTVSYAGKINPGMICAGVMKGGRDSCQGDSGGPLVCGNELVGVVSWGDGCAERNMPGVYADVYFYLDWIQREALRFDYSENGAAESAEQILGQFY